MEICNGTMVTKREQGKERKENCNSDTLIIFEKVNFLMHILKILQYFSQILGVFNDFRWILKLKCRVIIFLTKTG